MPIVEAPGQTGIGRFGWKDQHASLLSFSGDAYLNEMGITTRLFPDEVTKLCNTAPDPNDKADPEGLGRGLLLDPDHPLLRIARCGRRQRADLLLRFLGRRLRHSHPAG